MSPLLMAFLATLATWAATAAGAAAVFLVPASLSWRHQRRLLDASLGFAGGVMLAATHWGLLAPAMEQAQSSGLYGGHGWVPPAVGLIIGAAVVALADRCMPAAKKEEEAEGEAGGGGEAAAMAEVNQHLHGPQPPRRPTDESVDSDETADDSAAASAGKQTSSLPTDSLDPQHLNIDVGHREAQLDGLEHSSAAEAGGAKDAQAAVETAPAAMARRPVTPINPRSRPLVHKLKVSAIQHTQLDDSVAMAVDQGDSSSPPPLSRAERAASWRRLMLLVGAVTLHNLPEGLGVGVSFGALSSARRDLPSSDPASYQSKLARARSLTVAIGLQDIVEGLAVSLPLLRLGMSRRRAFFYGQLSGVAEPIGGVIGALAVAYLHPLLPFALAVAGGAMLFVVMHDLIPETRQRGGSPDLACWALIFGFAVMMSLDAGL